MQQENPLPVCLMLTADRPAMAERAIRCFARQTNTRSVLYVLDTGTYPLFDWCEVPGGRRWGYARGAGCGRVICAEYHPELKGRPLCWLMNEITRMAAEGFGGASVEKVFFKWDDDDYSHKERIAEQLGLLSLDPAREVVGYNSIPIAVHVTCKLCGGDRINRTLCASCNQRGYYCTEVREYRNESRNYAVGTSLAYTLRAWQAYPFPDTTRRKPGGTGSDTAFTSHWAAEGRLLGVDSTYADGRQMMIASAHAANTNPSMQSTYLSWPRLKEARERELRLLMEESN